MKQPAKNMGLAIDWGAQLTTRDPPDYYRWEQWPFVYRERGLVETKSGAVNWDPVD